ncbi:MAG: DUF1579 family protein [Planctomycetota bacterium]|nr:DUF1579 family protein [Planctomycetota bacterium]
MRLFVALTALATSSLVALPLLRAQDDEPVQDKQRTLLELSDAEKIQAQQQAMALSTPAAEHTLLSPYVGVFDASTKMWTGPNTKAVTTKGESTNEAVLGGRYLRMSSHARYEIRGQGTYEVESLQYLGFDRRTGKYSLTGFDTMGTYATTAEGTYDQATRTMTLSGTSDDPSIGITQAFDVVISFGDADTLTVKTIVYDAFQAGPFTLTEVAYTRRPE